MNFFQKILYYIARFLFPSKILGRENVTEGSAIFVCNHYSLADCVFILKIHPNTKDLFFLAKKEAFKNKAFAKILKSFGGIPIDRDNPDVKSLLQTIKVLKNGHKLCIFPEGTRNKSKSGELQPLKSGTGVFAVKAKCPIIPVSIMKKPRLFIKTKVLIGKPFDLEEFYNVSLDEEATGLIDKKIAEKMIENHNELKRIYQKKKKC